MNKSERSLRMSLIRSVDTKPEMLVRKLIHGMGYRYRLHVKDLPGTPDLAFPRLRKIVFVHGCFWHRHQKQSCRLARLPKSKLEFWETKLEGNRKRDQKVKRQLKAAGWQVQEIWECEMQNVEALSAKLRYFLENEIT